MRILLDSLLCPEKSIISQKLERMETLIENEIVIELYDILNEPFSITEEQKVEIYSKIRILFTRSRDIDLSHFKILDYNPQKNEKHMKSIMKKRDYNEDDDKEEKIVTTKAASTASDFHPKRKKKLITKPKSKGKVTGKVIKSKGIPKRPETTNTQTRLEISQSTEPTEEEKSELEDDKNELLYLENAVNCIKFKVFFEIDEEIPSKININILPQNGDDFEKIY